MRCRSGEALLASNAKSALGVVERLCLGSRQKILYNIGVFEQMVSIYATHMYIA